MINYKVIFGDKNTILDLLGFYFKIDPFYYDMLVWVEILQRIGFWQ